MTDQQLRALAQEAMFSLWQELQRAGGEAAVTLLHSNLRHVRAEVLREAAAVLQCRSAEVRADFLRRQGDRCYTGSPPELNWADSVEGLAAELDRLADADDPELGMVAEGELR